MVLKKKKKYLPSKFFASLRCSAREQAETLGVRAIIGTAQYDHCKHAQHQFYLSLWSDLSPSQLLFPLRADVVTNGNAANQSDVSDARTRAGRWSHISTAGKTRAWTRMSNQT